MINRCGYITFCDEDTNICNVATVVSYGSSNVSDADENAKSIYKYNFVKGKMLYCTENQNSKLPYLDLIDIIDKALSKDKLNIHITKYVFSFDTNDKVVIYKNTILKNCFPLPDKNLIYLKDTYYYNFTGNIFKKDVTSNLYASVACEHLNDIAIKNGYVTNRMFEHCSGRVFLNINMFMTSFEGRKILKQIISDFDKVASIVNVKSTHLTIKRFKNNNSDKICEDKSANIVLQYHIETARRLINTNLIETLKDTSYFKSFVEYEVNSILYKFDSAFPMLYNKLKLDDIYHLNLCDLLKLFSDSDFSYNIINYISDVRKVYNANKSRKIDCIKSDGSIYCIV